MNDEQRTVAAIQELTGRGRDPRKPHLFRGRIALKVKCSKEHHNLANVYVTTAGRLFVATWVKTNVPTSVQRGQLQYSWIQDLDKLPEDEREENGMNPPDWARVLPKVAPRNPLTAVGTDQGNYGAVLVTEDKVTAWASFPQTSGKDLRCRCGDRRLPWARLAEGIATAQPEIVIP